MSYTNGIADIRLARQVECQKCVCLAKNVRSFFRGCPDGQARIVSCCLSIEMNVLTDKTVLDVTVYNDLIFTLFLAQNSVEKDYPT